MTKLIAILNVVAWAGFWAFGYIALTTHAHNTKDLMTAVVLAAIGGAIGMWAYLRLVRHSEEIGYAKRPNRADKSHLEDNTNGESA